MPGTEESESLPDELLDVAMRTYLDARRKGQGPHTAARAVNATAREMERYINLNPAFADAVEDAVAEALELVANGVFAAAQPDAEGQSDLTAARMVLESHLPGEWLKPDRDMVLRLGADEALGDEGVKALSDRLAAAEAKAKAIEVTATEVVPDAD